MKLGRFDDNPNGLTPEEELAIALKRALFSSDDTTQIPPAIPTKTQDLNPVDSVDAFFDTQKSGRFHKPNRNAQILTSPIDEELPTQPIHDQIQIASITDQQVTVVATVQTLSNATQDPTPPPSAILRPKRTMEAPSYKTTLELLKPTLRDIQNGKFEIINVLSILEDAVEEKDPEKKAQLFSFVELSEEEATTIGLSVELIEELKRHRRIREFAPDDQKEPYSTEKTDYIYSICGNDETLCFSMIKNDKKGPQKISIFYFKIKGRKFLPYKIETKTKTRNSNGNENSGFVRFSTTIEMVFDK